MFPEVLASDVSSPAHRRNPGAGHRRARLGVTIALARHLPVAIRAQAARYWAQEELEGPAAVRTLRGMRMGIIGLGGLAAK